MPEGKEIARFAGTSGMAWLAEWYDLSPQQDALRELHAHLSGLQETQGIRWIANYRIREKTPRPASPGWPARVESDDPDLPRPQQFVTLTKASRVDVFFDDAHPLNTVPLPSTVKRARLNYRRTVFVEERAIAGPIADEDSSGPPAIQLGSFNVRNQRDEEELARFYQKLRFPQASRTRGCLSARKLLSVSGWAKHGILYAFDGMDAEEELFEKRFAEAADIPAWTGRHVLELVIHAPNAPHAGSRIWPSRDSRA